MCENAESGKCCALLQLDELYKTVVEHRPMIEDIPCSRILLLGEIGTGKSSFINSIASILSGNMSTKAQTGNSDESVSTQVGSDQGVSALKSCFQVRRRTMTAAMLSMWGNTVGDGTTYNPILWGLMFQSAFTRCDQRNISTVCNAVLYCKCTMHVASGGTSG